MSFPFFQYDFLQNAFLTGIMIGLLAPVLGVFIVVRRQSLIADALSHITLAGIAANLLLGRNVGFFSGLNPLYMGMVFSVGGAVGIEQLRKVYKHYEELAIPIIMSAGIGLSVIFISLANGFNTDLFNYLFGSVLAVKESDVWTIFFILLLVFAFVLFLYKELFVLSFDEEQAAVSGIRGKWIQFLFIVMVALVIASSMKIVGILLVSSLMTLPVAASIRLANGFKQTFVLSVIFGETAVILGLILSYYLDFAPGGTIVMISVIILLLSLLWKKLRSRRKIAINQ
ncbi:metal ABC transporter permease [Fictibacillus sp. WQ 8-8]|uniref:metal ABC transporter permease n=1 Tax=unclassified Fictibacillus TaxID=2644029 RepID=UPI0008E6CC85|nr:MULTISPECIES: metal ABC transporter permease [unclassified Fictibacillus]MCQ6266243.1 metal ABC transporter permease [Fictibacillus sp. WQ 8-8]MED2972537.1 metal ABC transporter permease [Fictibacillus sp. B-59209]SFD68306.1 zinc transport system permease protein [Bacillus sp. OV194]